MNIHESAEDYLETILRLYETNAHVRSIDIATELNVTKPSVSRAMKLLREGNYIVVDDAGGITLLPEGRAIAERIYTRHKQLTDFFVGLGVDPDVAAHDACKIEHDLSDETFEKMMAFSHAHHGTGEDACDCGGAHHHAHANACGCGTAHKDDCGCGCGGHSHAHEEPTLCGCGCGSHVHAHAAHDDFDAPKAHIENRAPTPDQRTFLESFSKIAPLPIAKYVVKSTKEHSFESVALRDVCLRSAEDSLSLIKETAAFLQDLESANLIAIDYETTLPEESYAHFYTSTSYALFEETVAQGKEEETFLGDIASLECGIIVMTAWGKEQLGEA